MSSREQMDDEISLLDIIFTFKKRKKLFWGVVVTFTCLAVGLAILKSNHYQFSQNYQVALYYDGGNARSIEPMADVLIDLNSQVIPTVINQYNQTAKHKLSVENFSAVANTFTAAGNGSLSSSTSFSLNVKGKESQLPIYKQLFTTMFNQETRRADVAFKNFKTLATTQLSLSQQSLADYLHEFTSLSKVVLAGQSIETSDHLAVAANATSEVVGIQSLAHIQELMTYRQMMDFKMTVQAKIQNIKATIAGFEFHLGTLSSLRSTSVMQRSEKTVGLDKIKLFWLVLVLGFFMAFMAVFLTEFGQKLQQQSD